MKHPIALMPKFNIHISVITYYVDVIKDQPFLIAALISQHSRNCVEFRSQDLCKPMQWNVPLNLRVTWARKTQIRRVDYSQGQSYQDLKTAVVSLSSLTQREYFQDFNQENRTQSFKVLLFLRHQRNRCICKTDCSVTEKRWHWLRSRGKVD